MYMLMPCTRQGRVGLTPCSSTEQTHRELVFVRVSECMPAKET